MNTTKKGYTSFSKKSLRENLKYWLI